MRMGVNILVVDDHEIVRGGIRKLIEESGRDWEICAEAAGGAEAVEAAQRLRPDVIILDIAMPRVSGLEAAGRIRKLGLGSRVLLFTMYESKRLEGEATAVGARGYVLKSQAARHLILAIDRILGGGTFFGKPEDDHNPEPQDETAPGGLVFFRSLAFGI
jgi:DNA-binding NarL/FixJ family response regulator